MHLSLLHVGKPLHLRSPELRPFPVTLTLTFPVQGYLIFLQYRGMLHVGKPLHLSLLHVGKPLHLRSPELRP